MEKQVTFWACDFETTVWGEEVEQEKGYKQDKTEVWSGADVRLFDDTETVTITHSIREFLDRFLKMKGNNCLYFHNLSFDGSFIVDFLLKNGYSFTTVKDKDMKSKEFKTSISDMGAWYYMKIKKNKTILEIRNSLKLLPSSLERIGESFKTKHRKLEMDYEGERYAYCDISEEEKQYIKNDVLVLKEALEMMFKENHNKLTIGSCCLTEFKKLYDDKEYSVLFPDIRDDAMDGETCGYWNMWEYVHKSYHGGWCYVNPIYAHRIITNGVVYDVNSLYPSMMHSVSGNKYPYGKGCYCWGSPTDDVVNSENKYYYIRVRCRFSLKPKCFPWLHIRGTALYKSNENLYTSDVRYRGEYYRYYKDINGNVQDTKQELIFTCTDWKLFKDTYYIYDLEILDYVWFWCKEGMFDEYINHYAKIKQTNKGFKRELAKLFLNNLYGKFAMSDNSSYKEPYLDGEIVKFIIHEEHEKKVGYIPIGSAITSYALNFTVRHAMANYERFCYADTDSVHLQGTEPANKIVVHPTELCCWKCEGEFDIAFYERQKVYAERIVKEDGVEIEPKLEIKCAGMGKGAKETFIKDGHNIEDLSVGLKLKSANLKAERINGGILLRKKDFKMRESKDKNIKIVK